MSSEGLYHEDAEWTAKVFYYAKKVSVYKQPYYMRRMRENSIMTSEDINFIFRKLSDRMNIAKDLVCFFNGLDDQPSKAIIINDFIRMYWGDLLTLLTLKVDRLYKEKLIYSTYDILKFYQNFKYNLGYYFLKSFEIKNVENIIKFIGDKL